MIKRSLLRSCLLAATAVSGAAQGNVWVVAPEPGHNVDFTSAQSAVDAASDLDLILFRPGAYEAIEVVDKDLRLIGEPGASIASLSFFVPGDPPITIRDLSAGKNVIVRGLDLSARTLSANGFDELLDTVEIQNCQGTILFEDCDLDAEFGGHALDVDQSDSVTLHRCRVNANAPFYYSFNNEFWAQSAIRSEDSELYLWESSVLGSVGPDAVEVFTKTPAGRGGDGIFVLGGSLTLQGSSITGGVGGSCPLGSCSVAEDGGHGIRIAGVADIRLLDVVVTAGAAGVPNGTPGSQFDGDTSGLVFNDGLTRRFDWVSPVAGGGVFPTTFNGEPDDFAFLLLDVGLATDQYFPDFGMTLMLPSTLVVVPLGVLPTGDITFDFDAPLLGPSIGFLQLTGQAAFFDTEFKAFLTGPSVVDILNQDEV